jgi:hypothetical protein
MLPWAAAWAAPIPDATAWPATGPVELELALPAGRPATGEPLLTTGELGRGDTVFVYYEAAGQVRFGWDDSLLGIVFSPPVPVNGGGPHRLLVSMGSLLAESVFDSAARSQSEALLRALLLVQFDGRTVLRSPGEFQPASAGRTVTLGANRVGSAVLRPFFTGQIAAIRSLAPEEALAKAMQVGRWTTTLAGERARYPGAVRLRLRLPREPIPAADPIIVTGRTGKGDFLYVQVLDADHVRFGFDHWAVGGITSPVIEADLSAVHELVLTMDALYEPGSEPEPWRGQVAIWLDGRRVLSGPSAGHPTMAEEIILGYNLIGGSTTGPVFRGTILGVETVAPAELARLGR